MKPTIMFVTDAKVKVVTMLWGPASPERVATEQAIHHYRVDQLSPHPKSMEFQRALEEDRE